MQFASSRPLPLLVVAVLIPVLASSALRAESGPSTARLGKRIENITRTDAAGRNWSLHALQGKKAVVVVFLSFECPVSTSYSQQLADLAKNYAERDVAVVGFCANEDLDATQIAQRTGEYHLPFPVFADARHLAADAFQAELTPEVFLLDQQFVLRYRGRIDDAYAARLKKNLQVTQHNLQEALEAVLAGKPVREPATRAVGCPIPRENEAKARAGQVTFHRDVLPILQNHCQTCHRPGEVGPFSLMTYRQAVNWASDIKDYTQSRKMPPWKPVAGISFHNERKLSDRDLATLAAWVDVGTPEGDPKDAPAARQFPEGWQLGKPDLVLTLDEEFQVGPSGRDLFRCFVLPTHLTEDKYVCAVEVRPSNPRVVHHVLLFIDGLGQGRKLEQQELARAKKEHEVDRGPGYSVAMGVGFLPQGGLSGWAPGQIGRYLPEGTGYFLPKGSDVVMQVHYHRNGRIEKDRTSVGLYFARKPVAKRFQGLTIPGAGPLFRFLTVPANAEDYHVKGTIWVDQDCQLYNVMPHMHMVGKKIKVTLTPPEGPTQTLVAIDDWDYNWQETYILEQPLHIQAGTRFDVDAVYDNSSKNPNNPNSPPKVVKFGEQTTDEMCFVFLGATADKPGRLRPRFQAPKKDDAAGEDRKKATD